MYGDFDCGGLKIGCLTAKNLALLAKWWLRFRTEKDKLWVLLISSIYGASGGLSTSSISVSRSIWPNVIQAGVLIESAGIGFERTFKRLVGDGASTLLWLDKWHGETSFAIKFPRLFALELNKSCYVKDRFSPCSQSFPFVWEWRHWPRGEELFVFSELSDILHNAPQASSQEDCCSWLGSSSGAYQFCVIANALDKSWSSHSETPTIWCNLLPKKINLFLWRARRSFLSCLLPLAIRGVSIYSLSCPLCAATPEDINHALFHCKFSRQVWTTVAKWWGLVAICICDCDDLFSKEVLYLVPLKAQPVWAAMLYVTSWTIWKVRNKYVMKKQS